MFRKMFGMFTAIAAALLVVGVAWASGDDSRGGSDSVPSTAGTTGSSVEGNPARTGGGASSSNSLGWSSSTSVDNPSTTSAGSSSTSVDGSSTTSISVVDPSTTSTTLGGSTTSTTLDATTSTSLGDDASGVDIAPTTYDVHGAGTVTLQAQSGSLVLLDVTAASEWNFELDRADGQEIRVELESGDSDARFEAKLDDGRLRLRIERD